MEEEMTWKEVLKGAASPDFLSMTIPGVTTRQRNLTIQIPEGKKIVLSKLLESIGYRGILEVNNIQDLPEMMRSDQIILLQTQDLGKQEELFIAGSALESGMVRVKTNQGEMLYNVFANLWVVVEENNIGLIPEIIARNSRLVKLDGSEEVF